MQPLTKLPVDPNKVRRVPRQFGAVDRNLVYRGLIAQLSTPEAALYLLLVCVADPQGLSYYSDRRLSELLGLSKDLVVAARDGLIRKRLILYQRPFYQLLDLPGDSP